MSGRGRPDDLLVGLEIHQQLACPTKLFCACPPVKSEELPYQFERRLRPAQSETGRVDPAAVFEFSKGKSNLYLWSPESSCLVEADEEPPHELSGLGLDSGLVVAKTLNARVVDEVHVMRKIVIDGSNTSGFQRTAVVALGGSFSVDGERIGVQSVTVEEDAARILGEDSSLRRFALDRLGVALVEVALDPVHGDPEFVGRVALHLGRILRSTGRVARGLGTIRQDLNVSLRGGAVVEVKGVQKLNLLPKVVDYEGRRQECLLEVADRLKGAGVRRARCRAEDTTDALRGSGSKVVSQQVASGGKVACVVAPGFAGLLGWEPTPGIRLGREVAEVARANSLGGIIHSDEFLRQGITKEEEDNLRAAARASPSDALLLLAGPAELVDRCVAAVVSRLEAATRGVPAETRAATDEGETRYMRPRPGSQRMYPETDIPNIAIMDARMKALTDEVPEDWESMVGSLEQDHSLSRDLALKLYDSDAIEEFEALRSTTRLEPSVIASALVDLPARMSREGVQGQALTPEVIGEVLHAVDSGKVAKEAIPEVLRTVGSQKVSVDDAISSMGLSSAAESEIEGVVDSVLAAHAALVSEKGESAFSPLMGEVMKQLRGRADGGAVSRVLRARLQRKLGGREG
jgi:glutamyl-tRNA(Gln) amidotransferase subunit E